MAQVILPLMISLYSLVTLGPFILLFLDLNLFLLFIFLLFIVLPILFFFLLLSHFFTVLVCLMTSHDPSRTTTSLQIFVILTLLQLGNEK